MDKIDYNSSIKVGDTVENVPTLSLINLKSINQNDHVVTNSDDADTEDDLDNGVLSNLETDGRD